MRLVIPFPPGGSADPVARVLANRLSEMWGQQVVAENKGGAGGNIAAQAVAQSAPDGYTLFLGSAFLAINPFLYSTMSYDPIDDLAPITLVCDFANVMVVPELLAREIGERFHRICQGQSRQGHLRVVGNRREPRT